MASSYDIAVVMDNTTLNKGMQQLYDKPEAKTKLFSGTQDVGKDGVKSVDWSIDASPAFTLSPPTQAQWDDKNTFFPDQKNPPANPPADSFQVELSKFSVKINLDAGAPIDLNFAATVFAEVTVAGQKVALGSVGVLPGDVKGPGQAFLEILAAVVFTQVKSLLAGYQIPSSIEVEGFDFTPPVATVTGSHLIAASNLTSTGPPDITGVSWPAQKLAVLASKGLMSAFVEKYSKAIVQEMDSAKKDYSGKNWSGSYSLTGGISGASISVGALPDVDVSATIGATAELGVSWWLVPAACAMEAASNLL